MSNYAIVLDNLRVRRSGRPVLNSVSCAIERGTVTGLLGPSGCGKTTLMRAVLGVQKVTGGSVTVLGKPAGHKQLRDKIGYATQTPAVYTDLTVDEALRYFAAVLRAPKSDVTKVIDEVGLGSHADSLVGNLSGGQFQRANLAVALLGNPRVLVLDEPTVGLDPVLRDELWDLFNRLAADGTTLLVSSHVMDEASRCDQLLLMREGELLAADSAEGLRRRTGQSDLEQAFLRLIKEVAPI